VDGETKEVIGCNLLGAFEKSTLKELYRQYLVEAFATSDAATDDKLFANLARLGLITGLEAKEINEIHNQIGGFIYRQYISKAIQKGPLGPQERQFLDTIKDSLGMDPEKCAELITDCQNQKVSDMVDRMFDSPQVLAEEVRKMRDVADLLDIDLKADIKVSDFRLQRMFQVEIKDLVDSGEISPDNLAAVEELCESLHVSQADAERMIEETVQKRTSGGLLQAACALRQGSGDEATKELEELLKYAALLGGAEAEQKQVSMGERNELLMLYQASLQADENAIDSAASEKLDLLRSVMGLADSATPA